MSSIKKTFIGNRRIGYCNVCCNEKEKQGLYHWLMDNAYAKGNREKSRVSNWKRVEMPLPLIWLHWHTNIGSNGEMNFISQ